jgi:Icc-related predicted phosphoesterase
MSTCFFVSDLHGNENRYKNLFNKIAEEKPSAVFIGGDILPSGLFAFTSAFDEPEIFIEDVIGKNLQKLKENLKDSYPTIFLIMGNDDAKVYEPLLLNLEKKELIQYVHNKKVQFGNYSVYGYANVPPTPFGLKDWERYDVSRYVDPGCTPPEEGSFTVEVNKKHLQYETIQKDLVTLCGEEDLSKSIFLFHTPPYKTNLDRANLDGKFFEGVPLDVHVGSIAVERFINERQPLLTLHGHIHESTALTGKWKHRIGNTLAMNAAHNEKELSLIQFDPEDLKKASRELI